MGFESQEEAERWAENAELLSEQRKEERLLRDPKEAAWRNIVALPAYDSMTPAGRELQRAVFDYAWDAALRSRI